MLKLIKGKKEQKQKEQEKKLSFLIERYRIMEEKIVNEYMPSNNENNQIKKKDFLRKISFVHLRKCLFKYDKVKDDLKNMSLEELELLVYELSEAIDTLTMLTPKMLKQIFPISKIYDGKKYDCLDYFSTKEALAQFDKNKPLISYEERNLFPKEEVNAKATKVSLMLMEYQNPDIRKANLAYLLLQSEYVRRIKRIDITEELMEEFPELKKSRMILHMTDNGKKYFVDSKGKSFSAKPTIPRNWRVITTKK